MLELKAVEKEIEKHRKRYSEAFQNYQLTGENRYYRTYTNSAMMIEALRMAVSVADIKKDAMYAEGEIASWAGRLENINNMDENIKRDTLEQIAKEILGAESIIRLRHKSR